MNAKLKATMRYFKKNLTSAANAGDVTLATINTGQCAIRSIIIVANAAITADLTKLGIYGGTSKVITFINDSDGAYANIDATDKQVAFTGNVVLGAAKTIVVTLTGTGATAVNYTVYIEYQSIGEGAYIS